VRRERARRRATPRDHPACARCAPGRAPRQAPRDPVRRERVSVMDRDGYVGRVWLDGTAKRWGIECGPDVMLRLKRIFERIPKEAMGRAPLTDSPLNAKELLWFMMGYRLRIGAADKLYLKRRAREEVLRQRALTKVLSGDYQPSGFRVAITPWDF